jgi:hypothetical protein
MGIVDVVDVAKSHILAMENTQAEVWKPIRTL